MTGFVITPANDETLWEVWDKEDELWFPLPAHPHMMINKDDDNNDDDDVINNGDRSVVSIVFVMNLFMVYTTWARSQRYSSSCSKLG